MLKSFNLTATAAIVLMLPAIAFAQNTYDINFTSNPPTIDGIVMPGEWADAAPEQGGWRILRDASGPIDAHNNTFQMTWDENNLYLLTESDWDGWTTNQRDQIRFGANNVNIFFDPNLDGEPSQGDPVMGPFREPDGYQFVANQYVGSYSCTACSTETNANPADGLNFGEIGSDFSTFAAARFDGLFGNNALWQGMRGTVMASVNGASGGVIEMAIPWTDFDAPALDGNGLDPGLNINGAAPSDGDTWFFNIGQITTDPTNALPIWNWHTDPTPDAPLESFASHPHGVVSFVAMASLLGDVNCDGAVDLLDIQPFVDLIVSQGFSDKADINVDGVVDLLDIGPFVALLIDG